jgi:four helix bundle protein
VITSYRDLRIWQQGVNLVEEVYGATRAFPRSEVFGLTGQMQRAAVSVPANIAEGQVRGYTGEYVHHLAMAHGSLAELLTLIEIAQRLSYLTNEQAAELAGRAEALSRQINALRGALGTKYPQSASAPHPS